MTGCQGFATEGGYCEKHQYMVIDYRKVHKAHCPEAYDNQWRKVRNIYYAQHPLCEDCLEKDFTVPAREVHHIIPVEHGGERLDFDNLVSLCPKCHHKRHIDIEKDRLIDKQLEK